MVITMFACCCGAGAAVALAPPDPRFAAYNGAGMLFTDGSVVLCGWEPRKRRPGLYGIGGKAERLVDRGDYRVTAAREVLEELFGAPPTEPLVDKVAATLCVDVARTELVDYDYVVIRQDFGGLRRLLELVRASGARSPLYARIPRTLDELLFARQSAAASEMAQLCLLPVTARAPRISADLCDDIERIWTADHPSSIGHEKQVPK
jgi:hypothetical protein